MHTLQIKENHVYIHGKEYPISSVSNCKIVNIDKKFIDSPTAYQYTIADTAIPTGWLSPPSFYICIYMEIGEDKLVAPVSYRLVRFQTKEYEEDRELAKKSLEKLR